MAVPASYLTSSKNTASIFDAIQRAGVPEKFSYEFLKQLGYSSSSDRPIIPVLKAIGFLNDASVPTDRYRRYKDRGIAKHALAQGIRDGYADVFAIDTQAHTKPVSELTGVFGRLSDKGESVTQKMALTFRALCSLADFDGSADEAPGQSPGHATEMSDVGESPMPPAHDGPGGVLTLRHDIHVHLPLSTDVAVYDAIFKALRAQLL